MHYVKPENKQHLRKRSSWVVKQAKRVARKQVDERREERKKNQPGPWGHRKAKKAKKGTLVRCTSAHAGTSLTAAEKEPE